MGLLNVDNAISQCEPKSPRTNAHRAVDCVHTSIDEAQKLFDEIVNRIGAVLTACDAPQCVPQEIRDNPHAGCSPLTASLLSASKKAQDLQMHMKTILSMLDL